MKWLVITIFVAIIGLAIAGTCSIFKKDLNGKRYISDIFVGVGGIITMIIIGIIAICGIIIII